MKVKNRQLYDNDCGISAIKNLLEIYKLKPENLNLELKREGICVATIKKALLNYFDDVECVSFNIYELKKAKVFTPYICLIKNNDIGHYIVIYKKTNKYLYILDSLSNYSYKITYENFDKIDGKVAIVPSNIKQKFNIKSLLLNICYVPFLSIIEALLMLSTTVLIQQIIDNGFNDALLYILVQLLLLFITTFKLKTFLKTFKYLDNSLVYNTNSNIFSLTDNFLISHDQSEVFYRLFDSYSYKSMILNFIFNTINDIVLFVLSYVLIFFYSKALGLILIPIVVVAIVIALIMFKKTKILVEEKRIKEYEYICKYKEVFFAKKQDEYKDTLLMLKKFQSIDYKVERFNMIKRLIFMCFQSVIISIVVLIYFTSLYELLSVGSLIALINLVSLLLQPLFNICSEISEFSNHNLLKERLKDIENNTI